MSVSLHTPHSRFSTHTLPDPTAPSVDKPALAEPQKTPQATSPQEQQLLESYLAAVQRKVVKDKPGLINVPPESQLGQWLGLFREQLQHPVVVRWMHEHNIDPANVTLYPHTGVLSAWIDGKTQTFSLTDGSGWAQVAGPLLAAGKVVAPAPEQKLQPRFDNGQMHVSAKVVASFYGEQLPTNPAQARAQIRRLEHNKAFDPLPADDRLRPASRRSPQALATQQQNAAQYYSGAPQALAFNKVAIGVARDLPNVRAEAKKWAEDVIFKLTGKHVDADTIYLNRFNTAQTGNTTTGWEHTFEEPFSSLRLPDALMKNFNEHDGVPGDLDLESGLYTDGPGQSQKGGYGAHNQFPLLPSAVMHESWKTDFQPQMLKKIDTFWKTQGKEYRTYLKGDFIAQARKQLKAYEAKPPAEKAMQPAEHQFTRKDYELVMGAVSNVPINENAPLTMEHLQAQAPAKGVVHAHAFDINGWGSSDIVRFTAKDDGSHPMFKDRLDGTQILYIPGANPAFLRFDSLAKLDQWVVDQAKDPKKREALASHFSLYNRQDGGALGKYGVDASLAHLATGGWSSSEGVTIDRKNTPIHGDVLSHITDQTALRMKADANTAIKSNKEVLADTWLHDVTEAVRLLVKMAPGAAPVAAVAIGLGAAEIGLGINKTINGDTAAERSDGAWKIYDGTLNILFTAVGAGGEPEDPFALPDDALDVELPDTPAPEVTEKLPTAAPEAPPANRLRPPEAGNISAHAVPNGEQLIATATRLGKGIYQTTDAAGVDHWFIRYTDATGARQVYEIKSGFKLSNNYVQIIDRSSRAPLLTVYAKADGEWARSIGPGGRWPWSKPSPSPTPADDVKAIPKFSDAFVDLDGKKLEGAERIDNYLKVDRNAEYEYSSQNIEENGVIKSKIGVSWNVAEDNFEVGAVEKAKRLDIGSNEYSPQFIADIHRFDYSVVVKNGLNSTRTVLKSTADAGEARAAERLSQFEALIPDPMLRARISEVAHQASAADVTNYMHSTGLQENYYLGGGNTEIIIEYDAVTKQAKVNLVSKTKVSNPFNEPTEVPGVEIVNKRTFTISESNEVKDSGHVYVIDKHAPSKVEFSVVLP